MSETNEKDGKSEKGQLSIQRPGRLELHTTVETGQVRQSFSHGRSKVVTVEVRRKRTFAPGKSGRMAEVKVPTPAEVEAAATLPAGAVDEAPVVEEAADEEQRPAILKTLTNEEKQTRVRALETARKVDQVAREQAVEEAERRAEDEARRKIAEEAERQKAEKEEKRKAEEEAALAAAAAPAEPATTVSPGAHTRGKL